MNVQTTALFHALELTKAKVLKIKIVNSEFCTSKKYLYQSEHANQREIHQNADSTNRSDLIDTAIERLEPPETEKENCRPGRKLWSCSGSSHIDEPWMQRACGACRKVLRNVLTGPGRS